VKLPYKIATLLYCFNESDDVLLMERAREPNRGLWSPCGGKLQIEYGESPYACACREADEELGLKITPMDLHLLGIISETGYDGQAHWLMFLFEVKRRLEDVPPTHPEGRFAFFPRKQLDHLAMPRTDVEQIWPLVWRHRNGFFAAHCLSNPEHWDQWTLEESRPVTKNG
jgi:8-oxo-dGTP diphosphatase